MKPKKKTQTLGQAGNKIKELRKKGIKISVVESVDKVMRIKRAEKFISQNYSNMPQSKRESFTKVLCKYEQFINTETK